MKCNYRKIFISILIMLFISFYMGSVCFAHSGRTDKNGGHKDNKNASGLGSYHYHCGGHPAHLHQNGVCPYSSSSSGQAKSSTSSSYKTSSNDNKSISSSSATSTTNNNSTSKLPNTGNGESSSVAINAKEKQIENTNTIINRVKEEKTSLFGSNSNNTNKNNNSEDFNPMEGIITVGLLGGGGYLIFKGKKNK